MADAARDTIADRYGTGRSRRIDRRVGWIVATLAVLGGVLFLVVNPWQENTTTFTNIGFTLEEGGASAHGATTKFEVTGEPGARISCAVEALNTAKATVGWKVVDLPIADTRTHTVTVRLVTTGPATAAHAKACWAVAG